MGFLKHKQKFVDKFITIKSQNHLMIYLLLSESLGELMSEVKTKKTSKIEGKMKNSMEVLYQ